MWVTGGFPMTHLRKMMLEELQRRNYSEDTTRFYIRVVEDFFRLLHRAAHLESEAQASSPCPLRHFRRWPVTRSHPLGLLTPPVLSFHQSAPSRLSRQVCCCSPASLP